MDAQLANLIESVLIDAIKIMGPAAIAAFATYKATKSQADIKLLELRNTHEFKARENLFDYYRDRQAQAQKGHEELNNLLGQIAGVTASSSDEESGSIRDLIEVYAKTADVFMNVAPLDMEITLRDMKSKGMDDKEEYVRLSEYKNLVQALAPTRDIDQLQKNIFTLLEAMGYLAHCNQSVLENQIERLFMHYTESA